MGAQGDSLWLRSYSHCNLSKDYFLDVQPTNDGGFVAAGVISSNDCGNPSQDFWVIKVDSMGCDTPDCDAVGVVEQLAIGNEQLAVKVYPNPSDGKFTFEISNLAYRQAGDEQRMSNVEVLVYDVMGRTAGSKQLTTGKNEIDLTNQADGIYFYRVAANGQFVTGKLIIH